MSVVAAEQVDLIRERRREDLALDIGQPSDAQGGTGYLQGKCGDAGVEEGGAPLLGAGILPELSQVRQEVALQVRAAARESGPQSRVSGTSIESDDKG